MQVANRAHNSLLYKARQAISCYDSPMYAENRKARFDYDFIEEFEAGIELIGHEVKAIRAGKASLVGSHIIVRGNELFILGLHIEPYQQGNTPDSYDPDRTRKLLVTKKEIAKIEKRQKGLTLIPIALYNKHRKIKVSFAIARGKKKADKRESIKKRETDREISRTLKR